MIMAYKVYFDGKKFTMEDRRSEPQSIPNDSTTHWNAEYDTAVIAVEKLNSKYKKNIEDLERDDDFTIRICKDCGEHFILTQQLVEWFKSRNMSVPHRCESCRKKRKSKQNKK